MAKRLDSSMGKSDDIAAASYRNINQSAGCSFEQIFTPIQIDNAKGLSNTTPGFRAPANEAGGGNTPFGNGANFGPTVLELDPYFPNVFGADNTLYLIQNCDYNNVVSFPSDDYNLQKNSRRSEVYSVRTQGLRAPVILSGWGFDLANLPVPYTASDVHNFDPNMVNDRATWKSGPLHVPWDEERQVWNAAGPQIMTGIVEQGRDINAPSSPEDPVTFNMRYFQYSRESGTNVLTNNFISITNRDPSLEVNNAQQDLFIMVIRVNYEWLPLWVGCD